LSPHVKQWNDYYAFGSILPTRSGAELGENYRYGFNGMEKDDEIKGDGNSYDFGARIYDPRIGRWMSCDLHESIYPSISPYVFVGNSPLIYKDPNGNDGILTIDYNTHTVTLSSTVHVYGASSTVEANLIVDNLNAEFDAMTNSYSVQDPQDPEVTWIVKINVEFVYNECIDEYAARHNGVIGNPNTNTDDCEALYTHGLVGINQGDNVYKIDNTLSLDTGGPEGLATIGGNEATGDASFRVAIHEVFHLLGFDERYFTSVDLPYGPYIGDVLSNDKEQQSVVPRQIMPFHFVDLLDWALDSHPEPKANKVSEIVGNRGNSKANPGGRRLKIDDTGGGNTQKLRDDAKQKDSTEQRAKAVAMAK